VPRPQDQAQAPRRRWAAWLALFLLIPLAAASAGALYVLYRHLVTGQLTTVAKSYGATSRTISFSESPTWFLVFFALHAAVAAAVIFVTVVLARLAVQRLRGRS
jgi:cobalamin synthase